MRRAERIEPQARVAFAEAVAFAASREDLDAPEMRLYMDRAFEQDAGAEFGTMARCLHVIGELFSGDPYVANSSGATQAGIRHFVSRFVQIDATVGQGVWGDERLPLWCSLGLRIASDPHLF